MATARPAHAASGPIPFAHAHNDYGHERPLLDALSAGFTSVEADVWLVDGELRLGHTRLETRPGWTLRSAYLEPLAKLADRGALLPGFREPLQLLIDLKSEGESTYAVVERELACFPRLFSEYAHGRVTRRHVTAVLSGARPLSTIAARSQRFSFVDGRPGDIGRYPTSLMPLISRDYYEMFAWIGVLPMPDSARERLNRYVESIHMGGQKVRFYNTPDLPSLARGRLWDQLRASGVDWLNTDDLPGMRAYADSRA